MCQAWPLAAPSLLHVPDKSINVFGQQMMHATTFPEYVCPGIPFCEFGAPLPQRVRRVLAIPNNHEATLLLGKQRLNLVEPAACHTFSKAFHCTRATFAARLQTRVSSAM